MARSTIEWKYSIRKKKKKNRIRLIKINIQIMSITYLL